MLLAHPLTYLFHLVGTEVGHSAHPHAKAPERRHGGIACKVSISTENLFGMVATYHKGIYHCLALHKLHRTGGEACQRQFGMGAGVIEHAIHPAGEIEGDILIGSAVVDTLSVLILQIEGLSAEIHLCKSLTRACKALVCLALERQGGTVDGGACFAIAQGQGIVAGGREVIVGSQSHLTLAIRIEAQVEGFLRVGQQGAPAVQGRLLHVDEGTHPSRLVGDAPPRFYLLHTEGHLLHPLTVLQHLVAVGGHCCRGTEGGKHTDNLGSILPDNHRIDLSLCRGVGGHIVRVLLFLKGHGDPYITLVLRYRSGLTGLPQRFLFGEVLVEIEKVEEIIVCGNH